MRRKPTISGAGIYPAWEARVDAVHDANILKRPYPDKLADERPAGAICFDQGYSWPPRGSEAGRVLEEAAEQALLTGEAAVCVAVDQKRGTITFASSPLKPGGNGLVRPMDESEARYLGLLYLEAQWWI